MTFLWSDDLLMITLVWLMTSLCVARLVKVRSNWNMTLLFSLSFRANCSTIFRMAKPWWGEARLIQAPRSRRLLKVGSAGREILAWARMIQHWGLPTDNLLVFEIVPDDKDKGDEGARVYPLLPPKISEWQLFWFLWQTRKWHQRAGARGHPRSWWGRC